MRKIKQNSYTKIFISDSKRFADIALLIDNTEYIKSVNEIRNKFGIEKLFKGSLSELERFPYRKEENSRFPKKLKHNRIKNWIENVFLPKQEKYTNKEIMLGLLTKEANNLLVKFGCPSLMLRVVLASIICGRVSDEDSVPARLDFIDRLRFQGAFKDIPALAIEITPFTSKEDVLEEFKKKKVFYKDYLAFYRHLNANLSKDLISTIKRDREWYWGKVHNPKNYYLSEALKRENIKLGKYLDAKEKVKMRVSDVNKKRGYEKILERIEASILYIKKRVSQYKKLISSQKYLKPQLLY